MKIEDMSWQQVETLVEDEKRAILPLGSVEQHGKLSLAVDMILAHKVSVDAAEPLGVPVYPVLPYGIAPYFSTYPGSVTFRMETYLNVVRDLLDSMYRSGHRKILIVNGHGGNSFIGGFAQEWLMDHPDVLIKFYDWWAAPKTMAFVQKTQQGSSHASWMENFAWTRLAGASYGTDKKEPIDLSKMKQVNPDKAREIADDGNFGGSEIMSDELTDQLWDIAVEETRAVLNTGWTDL